MKALITLRLCVCADPRLTDYDTLLKNIQDLKSGRPTQVATFTMATTQLLLLPSAVLCNLPRLVATTQLLLLPSVVLYNLQRLVLWWL